MFMGDICMKYGRRNDNSRAESERNLVRRLILLANIPSQHDTLVINSTKCLILLKHVNDMRVGILLHLTFLY